VLLCKKAFLTGVLVVVAPGTPLQLFVGLLCSVFYMALVLRTGPYVGDHEDVLSFLTSASLTLTLLAGLAKITDTKARTLVSADDLIREATLGWILMVVNTIPMVYFLSINVGRCVFRQRIRVQRRKTRRIKEEDLQHFVALQAEKATAEEADSAAALAIADSDKRITGGADSLVKILPANVKTPVEHSPEEHADQVMKGYRKHEAQLVESHNRRKKISARKTQLRLLARNKLKSSRALSQVPAFAHLSEVSISTIVDSMAYESFPEGAILCREGDIADCMYVIISGACIVTSKQSQLARPGKVLANLKDLDIVGESMMCKEESERVRIATVTAGNPNTASLDGAGGKRAITDTGGTQQRAIRAPSWRRSGVTVLTLTRAVFEKLVHSGIVSFQDFALMRSSILSTSDSRRSQNKNYFVAARAMRQILGQPRMDVSTSQGSTRRAVDMWKNKELAIGDSANHELTSDEPH
jgi:CRP-like cAMP-binding protein